MSQYLIPLWAGIAFAIFVVYTTRLPLKIRIAGRQPFNRKPFNCEPCLSFWIVAAFAAFAIYPCIDLRIIAIIGLASTAGIITPLIVKLINR